MLTPTPALRAYCLAPELDDAKLARYEELAAKAPPAAREAMEIYLKCVKTWWNLPVSKTPVQSINGLADLQALDEPTKKALYDLIPYEDEMKTFSQRFEELGKEDAQAFSQQIEDWQAIVSRTVRMKHFSNQGEYDAALALMKIYSQVSSLFSPAEKKVLEEKMAKVQLVHDEVTKAIKAKHFEGIPYPAKPTSLMWELRNAAFHLSWFVRQLNLDREPPCLKK